MVYVQNKLDKDIEKLILIKQLKLNYPENMFDEK